MIKLICIGLIATAAVWFVTSKDHVLNFIENDLSKRVAEVVTVPGENSPEFTVTGRDVVLFGSAEHSAADLHKAVVNIDNVSGVERVFLIDSFADPQKVSSAVVALTNQDQFTLAAHVVYDGSEISLIGNGTGESATNELLAAFGEQNKVAIKDNMFYENSKLAGDWVQTLSTWLEFLPTAGPGWVVVTAERVVVSMEDSSFLGVIGERLDTLGLPFDVSYGTRAVANDNKPLPDNMRQLDNKPLVTSNLELDTNTPLDNEPAIMISQNASSSSISNDQCNELLRAIIADGSINFRHGSDDLSNSSVRSLAKIRDTLSECGPGMLTISGHTDSLGNREYNRTLSTVRAGVVMDELLSLGVLKQELRATGFGEDQPIATNDTSGGRWLNRRIEMVLE